MFRAFAVCLGSSIVYSIIKSEAQINGGVYHRTYSDPKGVIHWAYAKNKNLNSFEINFDTSKINGFLSGSDKK